MIPIEVQFLGSGDAFGSGGRLQSCVMVKHDHGRFLIDCGASGLTGMVRYGINPNEIDFILISHLHGDHCGGIPFFITGSQLIFRRTEPLLIIGPPGIKELMVKAMEAMFPGSSDVQRKFAVEIREFSHRDPEVIGTVKFTPYLNFNPQVDPSFALRIECGGKIIGYSSDTQWTDALRDVAADADLFIAEAYFYEKQVKGHMDYTTLMSRYGSTGAKRLVLTHMSPDMLTMRDRVACECADDGKVFII
jgi:ribonuclease BN (tRNA processing enzyme)